MKNINEIKSLELFLSDLNEPPLLITGTFDPIHKGHLYHLILKNLKRYEESTSLVILPHDINSSKKNRTSIAKRREWI